MTLVRNPTPPPSTMSSSTLDPVEILILGAGWSSTFLIPLLQDSKVSHAATSTTGRSGTIPFKFNPEATDSSYFSVLPSAKTIIIVFPLTGTGQSNLLVKSYEDTHPDTKANFIQLGSSGIWGVTGEAKGAEWADKDKKSPWMDRHSKYNEENPRAIAEDELRERGGCVLNLSGLWGGERKPWNFIPRVAVSKEQIKGKTSLHMIHGRDVARGILAVHSAPSFPSGSRWMLTDMMVYDWWALLLRWGDGTTIQDGNGGSRVEDSGDIKGKQLKWVRELMDETATRALPRSADVLARCYDSREFWQTFGLVPVRAGL